jgi:membrane-bound lytic murein transglycosylase A
LVATLLALALASCTTAPVVQAPIEAPVAVPPRPAVTDARDTITQTASRWVPVGWQDLPGFADDGVAQALPALRRNCDKAASASPAPAPAAASSPSPSPSAMAASWQSLCQELGSPSAPRDDTAVRAWLQQRFTPYRVEALDSQRVGLATGYFEPLFEASRVPRGAFRHALHRTPTGWVSGQRWYTRKESQTVAGARAALQGRELAYLTDPVDVLMLQIQGSGRLSITEPDGRRVLVRMAFAGHNEHSYESVARWLIARGEIARHDAGWPAIRAWAKRNPERVDEMLWSNPRLVFFKEEPLPDPSVGPRGAQGVALTAERSIAVDPKSIPYGTPVWLSTTEPTSNRPLRRLMVAQDTGGAIVGAVRADYFWGAGDRAEREASRMKHPLEMWVLVPRSPG